MEECKRVRNGGMVFIVALWIILTIAGTLLVFGRSMRVELLVSANRLAALRADWIARGVLQLVLSQIDSMGDESVMPGEDYNWEAVALGDGFFWVIARGAEDGSDLHFGISDESAKLNLNAATLDMIYMLPGMTDELAASIADWIRPDEDSTAGGAKSEYYLLLSPPYQCKSGPLETVEEVLLVKGGSMDILFGEDINRNGVLDPNENDGADTAPQDNMDGLLDRGIYDFVTVYSSHSNVSLQESDKVDVNSSDTTQLREILGGVIDSARLSTIMNIIRRGRPFLSLLDFYARTGLSIEEFEKIAPMLTAGARGRTQGLINVNTAPREVLLCLPGLDEADVDTIMDYRASLDSAGRTNIAWVARVLPLDKLSEAGGWLTVRSYHFSADIVAVSGDGKAFRRYRAVLDGRNSPPLVISWQDITGLGWPLDPVILGNLKKGIGPDSTVAY
ncbi:MAG TPA: type II secretion system protein GspK [bacterium]|nr:type II secretion system protein GspK [bacterium]